jgi:arylsulfatase A-like enzyme
MLRDCDAAVAYLLAQLKKHKILDSTNIILTADHGFVNTYSEHTHIDIDAQLSAAQQMDKQIQFRVSEHSVFPIGWVLKCFMYKYLTDRHHATTIRHGPS